MIGPLQLIVVGFDEDKYARDIILELKNLRKAKMIRLFDLLYVFKHPDGTIDSKEASDLQAAEQREFGPLIKSLIGLSTKDLEHVDSDEVAETLKSDSDDYGLSTSDIQAVADQLPNNSSAIFVLFEHTWARGLKAAMLRNGGTVKAQGMVDPKTLQTATNELAAVLEAIEKSESAAMDKMVGAVTEAKAQEEGARAQAADAVAEAETVTAAAAAALMAAELKTKEAEQAVAEAQSKEEEALLRAEEIAAEARAQEEAARLRVEEAEAAAQAQEDAAFAEADAVRRAAERQIAQAEEKAAEAVRVSEEIEAKAVLRAVNALVAARVIEKSAAREALDAIIGADVIEVSAARQAAEALSSGR
jgi:uncharacterized membrane protein